MKAWYDDFCGSSKYMTGWFQISGWMSELLWIVSMKILISPRVLTYVMYVCLKWVCIKDYSLLFLNDSFRLNCRIQKFHGQSVLWNVNICKLKISKYESQSETFSISSCPIRYEYFYWLRDLITISIPIPESPIYTSSMPLVMRGLIPTLLTSWGKVGL